MNRPLILGLCVGLLGAGCATKGDVASLEQTMASEMQQLRADQERLLAQLIGAAFDSIDATERRAMTGMGESQRQFDELREQLLRLVELTSQNNQLLNELYASRGSVPGGDTPTAVSRPTGSGTVGSDEASMFYSAAQQQFGRGAYETARAGFQDFLENYPDHELAPDAQYFLAETYAAANEAETALTEYGRVLELYPDSRRAPTALYKSGMIELESGNVAEARNNFSRVQLGYPNSPEAELAADQLRRLGG